MKTNKNYDYESLLFNKREVFKIFKESTDPIHEIGSYYSMKGEGDKLYRLNFPVDICDNAWIVCCEDGYIFVPCQTSDNSAEYKIDWPYVREIDKKLLRRIRFNLRDDEDKKFSFFNRAAQLAQETRKKSDHAPSGHKRISSAKLLELLGSTDINTQYKWESLLEYVDADDMKFYAIPANGYDGILFIRTCDKGYYGVAYHKVGKEHLVLEEVFAFTADTAPDFQRHTQNVNAPAYHLLDEIQASLVA